MVQLFQSRKVWGREHISRAQTRLMVAAFVRTVEVEASLAYRQTLR